VNRRLQVVLVDGESEVRDVVETVARQRGLEVTCLASVGDLLQRDLPYNSGLVIASAGEPELADLVRRTAPRLPVVAMVPKDDVPAAIRAMKAGATDVLQKPLDRQELLHVVDASLRPAAGTQDCPAPGLTPMESCIMRLLVDGKSNRQIATVLHRSVRTIEVHRSRIMSKTGARNLVDLVMRASQEA
jgi:FixJ family two-component response regulator